MSAIRNRGRIERKMKLKNRTTSDLAEMICGNEPLKNFPYRSSGFLSDFFRNCDLDFQHDGTTRALWVRSVLDQLNDGPAASPSLPSDSLVRVIQELMDPTDFERNDKSQAEALIDLNKVLGREGLEAYLDGASRCHLKSVATNQSTATMAALRKRAWSPAQQEHRRAVSNYLDRASEDEFIEVILVPLFAHLGFIRISVTGHKDKLLEYGKDLWMKFQLPTTHFIYFGAQVKRGKLDSAGKSANENIAEVYRQVLMMLEHPVFDPESNRKHLLDHVFIIAGGDITKPARAWLVEKLDTEARRRIIFMDRDEILDLATGVHLALPEPTAEAAEDDFPF